MSVDSSVVVASGKLMPGGKELVGNELSSWPSHSVTPCVGKSEFNTSYSSISSDSDKVLQTTGCFFLIDFKKTLESQTGPP